jgi:hypothetical protein
MTEPRNWSKTHELAYLYLALAHGADQDLAKSEKKTIVQKVEAWDPLIGHQGALDLLNQVAKTYMADRKSGDASRTRAAIRRLKGAMSKDELSRALTDLVELAQADGVILDAEWDFIDDAKKAWGVLGA